MKMKIMVGIPSYNNADTIGFVVKQVAEGLKKHFGGGIIANADGGSKDGTRDVVLNVKVPKEVEVLSFVYKWPIPGKGSAMKELMELAREKDVDILIFVDSDLRSIAPEWIYKFAKPVMDGFDFVAPFYIRHKYDATITNNIAFPMTTALYGFKIRQPIGGDFGISSKLFDVYLRDENVWKTDVAKFGVDIFLTTTALAEGFKVTQVSLGAKIHNPKDPAQSLGPMFNQVVGTLFMLMKKYENIWRNVKEIKDISIIGKIERTEPEEVKVDLERLKIKAREGFEKNKEILQKVLSKNTFEGLKRALKTFDLDDVLWSHVLYDAAAAYKRGVLKTLESLVPLYFAKTANFVEKTKDMNSLEAEQIIEERARTFLKEKNYLLARW